LSTRVKVFFGSTLSLLLLFFAVSPMTCALRLRDDVELGFEALRAGAAAEALLGHDPRPSWVGLVGGKIGLGPTTNASHQYPVVGSKAGGLYFFVTNKDEVARILLKPRLALTRTLLQNQSYLERDMMSYSGAAHEFAYR
jgi:hypothetical protein